MRAEAVYRALLYFYPAAFRQEYGDEMLLAFADQLGEVRRTGRRFEQASLWIRATSDALTIAPKEHCHVITQDLRYAFRTMAVKPGFTAVAVISLALGIGANTAIFSLWSGVLHSSLPGVYKPEELVMLSNPDRSGSWTGSWDSRTDGPRAYLTYEEFEQFRDHAGMFSALMASQTGLETWQVRFEGGAPEEAHGRLVSGGFFQVLGVSPAVGRVFTAAEDRADLPSAVISYGYWQRRFGGRPDVIGKTVRIQKGVLTIIGVAARGFFGETSGQQPDLWLPLRMQPVVMPGKDRMHDTPPEKSMWLHVFGRLKPGITRPQAEAQAEALFQAGLESFYGNAMSGPRRNELLDQHLRLSDGSRGASHVRQEFSNSLTALLAAVGVLLMIACANLANLLLARGAVRKHEIALRLSLGASRGRLIRQLITESLALAALGGVAALVVAYFAHGALVRMMAEADPRFDMTFTLDPLLWAFVLAATLAAALLFGVLPAWQVTRTGAVAGLKEQSRGSVGSMGQMRSGRLLVSLQLALSLPLLVGAGLLARTVYNLQRADLGFPTDRLLVARVDLGEDANETARRDRVRRELTGEIQRIPGVRSVSFSSLGLYNGGESVSSIRVEGYTPKSDNDRSSPLDAVGPGYFSTLGIPMVMGREIQETDQASAPKVCVINEAFARRFFDRRNPIGMRIAEGDDDHATTRVVIGVARNAHTHDLRGDVAPRYFVAAAQLPGSAKSPTLLIRTITKSAPVTTAVRATIRRIDAGMPILYTRSMEEQLAPLTALDRTTAQLAVVFGAVAITLAAIGLYGVLSYGIARRTGEIAIRIALGARPGRVIGMILRETIGIVCVGLAMGGALAYVASRWIGSRLYGVAPEDPLTLALATGLLLSVALTAAYLPALRASRLDPMTALRRE